LTCRGETGLMAYSEEKDNEKSFWRSCGYACEGVSHVFRTQRNFRIHLAIAGIVMLAGVGLGLSGLELAVVGVTIAFVTIAEMLNTVVEAVVNLITPDYHPWAKIAKDVGAGAVLLSAVWSVFVAGIVFGPHLLRLIG